MTPGEHNFKPCIIVNCCQFLHNIVNARLNKGQNDVLKNEHYLQSRLYDTISDLYPQLVGSVALEFPSAFLQGFKQSHQGAPRCFDLVIGKGVARPEPSDKLALALEIKIAGSPQDRIYNDLVRLTQAKKLSFSNFGNGGCADIALFLIAGKTSDVEKFQLPERFSDEFLKTVLLPFNERVNGTTHGLVDGSLDLCYACCFDCLLDTTDFGHSFSLKLFSARFTGGDVLHSCVTSRCNCKGNH